MEWLMLFGLDLYVSEPQTGKHAGNEVPGKCSSAFLPVWVFSALSGLFSAPSAVCFFCAQLSLLLSAARQQIGANKGLQIAVEHAIDIADFDFGAMILDQAVRLQDIGANLRSELDVEF